MRSRFRAGRAAVLFVPLVLALFFYETVAARAVGLMSPRAALTGMEAGEKPVFANPFRGFSLKKEEEKERRRYFYEEQNGGWPVTDEFFPCAESDIVIRKEECYVKNLTRLDNETVRGYMLSPIAFSVEKNSPDPQILIMHTHATESYLPPREEGYDASYSFRSTDNDRNMTAVGKVMRDRLNRLGYNTLQDVTLHDYPSYNGSYDASRATVEKYLRRYPSIKIVLDVHRDAVERDGNIINPSVEIDGVKFAQIMIISGADNGYMNMPNYPENLKFASMLQNEIASRYPGLARPVLFDYRNYNQQLTTGSILVEVGSHGATLSMAKNSALAFADCLARALDKNRG